MNSRKLFAAAAACTLLLSGCGTVSTSVSDPNEALMTIGDVTYTRNDEYQLIKRVNGPSLTLQAAQRMIYNEEVGDGEDIQKEAQEMYDTYAGTSSDFEKQLQSYGYKDKEDYIDNVLIPSIQSQKLVEKYFTDGKETIEADFKPVKAAIIQTDSQDNAEKALNALKEGQDAGKVGGQYAADGAAYTGTAQIITTMDTSLPTRIINTLYETTKEGVIDEIFTNDTSTDDKQYFVVKLISKDYDANLKEIQAALSSNSDINSDCVVYYLKKYEFQVHDQFIFDYFKANYPQYLVTRPDLSEDSSN